MTQFTESQLKLIDEICFHAGDLKTGTELGQFLIEDIEAIRKACDELAKEIDTRQWIPASDAMENRDIFTVIWGWSKDDKVRIWLVNDSYWATPASGDYWMPFQWDLEHQPTHVMLYINGEEPPAPPMEVNDAD